MTLRSSIITIALFGSAALHAQNPQHSLVLESNPQLTSSVAAALSDLKTANMSQAEFSFAKDDGEFIGIDGSSDCWTAKAGAESYSRISDRMVFYGGLSYSYFHGANMSGSVLRDMYYNPVAFLEQSTETAGVKTRELYTMTGAMSYSFSDHWSSGLKLDYESGNNVKTKDPRYRSEWYSLDFSASTWYRKNKNFAVGASLIYRSTQEMVMSHIYGTTDKTYYLIIDRGGFFGTLESVEGTYGVVSPSSFQPMKNNFYGGSVEVMAGIYHADAKVLYRDGKYGIDSSHDPCYFNYNGLEANFENGVLINRGSSLHDIHMSAGFKSLKNIENTFKYVTHQGSNTVVEYNGAKEALDRKEISAALGYKGSTGIHEGKPSMQFGADASMEMRNQTATIYPLYRKHQRTSIATRAFFDKYFYTQKGIFAIEAAALAGAGTGVAAEDGSLASSTGGTVKTFDDLLNRQFEHETAPFAGGGLRISYTKHLKRGMDAYISISDNFRSLLGSPEYLFGRTRNAALLSIGLNL